MLSLGAAALLSPQMLHRHPNVEHRDGVTGLTISDAEPFPYQVDGEYLGEVNRLDFAYEPDVLTIVRPGAYPSHLFQCIPRDVGVCP